MLVPNWEPHSFLFPLQLFMLDPAPFLWAELQELLCHILILISLNQSRPFLLADNIIPWLSLLNTPQVYLRVL